MNAPRRAARGMACESAGEPEQLRAAGRDTTRTLQQWFDHAPGLIALVRGPNYVFEIANRAYYQLIGHREILGKPAFEALPELRDQGLEALLDHVFTSGERFVGQGVRTLVQREPGGSLTEAFFDFVYEPVFDPDGTVSGIFAHGHEVTEQYRVMAALRASQERFERIFQYAAVGIAVLDQQGRFAHVNSANLRILGYTEDELRETTFLDVTHPDDRAASHAQIEQLRVGQAEGFVIEKRYLHKDGHIVWGRTSVTLVPDTTDGAARVVATIEDVTARRQAELRFEEEHAWLALALGAAQMGIWEWNFATGERRWNDAMYELYGVDRTTVKMLAPPHIPEILSEDRERMQHEIARLRASGGTAQIEFRIRRQDTGQIRWILSRGTIRCDAQGAERMLGVSYDITERKAAEHKLVEADQRKDEFLAMLAHELRNPLAPLTNALKLLERSASLTEPNRAALAMAGRQTRQLTRLVDDLLEISRITRGKIELRREPMSVGAAVHLAAESVASRTEQRRQTIELVMPSKPVRINADPARIAQVLENLLTNASKYAPEGGAIRIEVEERSNAVEIRIIDNGIGIEPDKIAHLFELFHQIDATLDRAHGGLGIGLALVKRLVELHGGTVAASSAGKGQGAVFTVRLPSGQLDVLS